MTKKLKLEDKYVIIIIFKRGATSMKKLLIMQAVKFMQNLRNETHSVHAQMTQCDYVRSTGGGAKI